MRQGPSLVRLLVPAITLGLALGSAHSARAKLSLEQCRQRAAKFLGVAADELLPRTTGGVPKSAGDSHPTTYTFIVPYRQSAQVEDWERHLGRARIAVEAESGEVSSAWYEARRYEIGARALTEADAKAVAADYLEAHWAKWGDARFLSATKPWQPSRAPGPRLAPKQDFHWVVEEGQIRTGRGSVQVNLTTGKVLSYTQHYHSPQGLAPPRVSRQQAINALLNRLDKSQRVKASVQEAYLATRWYKGGIRLTWVVRADAPARMRPRYRGVPIVRSQILYLDAHTGKVYTRVE